MERSGGVSGEGKWSQWSFKGVGVTERADKEGTVVVVVEVVVMVRVLKVGERANTAGHMNSSWYRHWWMMLRSSQYQIPEGPVGDTRGRSHYLGWWW